jgi:hypothetical protein
MYLGSIDLRPGNGTASYSESCSLEPETPPSGSVAIDLTLLVFTILLIILFMIGLAFMIPSVILMSGLGFFIVGATSLIEQPALKIVYVMVGVVITYVFVSIAMARD